MNSNFFEKSKRALRRIGTTLAIVGSVVGAPAKNAEAYSLQEIQSIYKNQNEVDKNKLDEIGQILFPGVKFGVYSDYKSVGEMVLKYFRLETALNVDVNLLKKVMQKFDTLYPNKFSLPQLFEKILIDNFFLEFLDKSLDPTNPNNILIYFNALAKSNPNDPDIISDIASTAEHVLWKYITYKYGIDLLEESKVQMKDLVKIIFYENGSTRYSSDFFRNMETVGNFVKEVKVKSETYTKIEIPENQKYLYISFLLALGDITFWMTEDERKVRDEFLKNLFSDKNLKDNELDNIFGSKAERFEGYLEFLNLQNSRGNNGFGFTFLQDSNTFMNFLNSFGDSEVVFSILQSAYPLEQISQNRGFPSFDILENIVMNTSDSILKGKIKSYINDLIGVYKKHPFLLDMHVKKYDDFLAKIKEL